MECSHHPEGAQPEEKTKQPVIPPTAFTGTWRLTSPLGPKDRITTNRTKNQVNIAPSFDAAEIPGLMKEKVLSARKKHDYEFPDVYCLCYLSPAFKPAECPRRITLVNDIKAMMGAIVYSDNADQQRDKITELKDMAVGEDVDLSFVQNAVAPGKIVILLVVFPLTHNTYRTLTSDGNAALNKHLVLER